MSLSFSFLPNFKEKLICFILDNINTHYCYFKLFLVFTTLIFFTVFSQLLVLDSCIFHTEASDPCSIQVKLLLNADFQCLHSEECWIISQFSIVSDKS